MLTSRLRRATSYAKEGTERGVEGAMKTCDRGRKREVGRIEESGSSMEVAMRRHRHKVAMRRHKHKDEKTLMSV